MSQEGRDQHGTSRSTVAVGGGCLGGLVGSVLTFIMFAGGLPLPDGPNILTAWGAFLSVIVGAPVGFIVGLVAGLVLTWLVGTGSAEGRRVSQGPQLVGQMCVLCWRRIASDVEGEFCPECGCAVHHDCVRPEKSALGRCSRCGGNPTLELPPDYHG